MGRTLAVWKLLFIFIASVCNEIEALELLADAVELTAALPSCAYGANEVFYNVTNSIYPNGILVHADSMDLGLKSNRSMTVEVHGFLSGGDRPMFVRYKNAALAKSDTNVVVVDWTDGSCSNGGTMLTSPLLYPIAANNTRRVGADLANMIVRAIREYGILPENIHLIGHSLGSHICGFAGKGVRNAINQLVGRITGCDPAGPLFEGNPPTDRLDSTDAVRVNAQHTSLAWGIHKPVATMDSYHNGGVLQLSCLGRLDELDQECSHSMSFYYAVHNLENPTDCPFQGQPWPERLSGIPPDCANNTCASPGSSAFGSEGTGIYCVDTSNMPAECVAPIL